MKCTTCLRLLVLLAAGGCAQEGGPGEDAQSYVAVGDVQELMATMLDPTADVYWRASGVIVDAEGEHVLAPQNEEEWEAVRAAAYTIAETGNILMREDLRVDDGAWMEMSRALVDAGKRALEAAEAQNLDAVFDMGAEVYYVCVNCHAVYALETLRPNDPRAN